jgi:hypothetical protein
MLTREDYIEGIKLTEAALAKRKSDVEKMDFADNTILEKMKFELAKFPEIKIPKKKFLGLIPKKADKCPE